MGRRVIVRKALVLKNKHTPELNYFNPFPPCLPFPRLLPSVTPTTCSQMGVGKCLTFVSTNRDTEAIAKWEVSASFKKCLGVGAGDIKSMVPIELKTQIKSGSALFCFPHQRNLRPQSNSLPWGRIKPGFSTSQKTSWPNSTGSPRLATTSIHSPLSPLPSPQLWAGVLVSFFTFPGPCCTLPALQTEDIFPRKPGETPSSFF